MFLYFLISVDCVNHVDCPNDKACVSQKCVDPCSQNSPCASSAKCSVDKHEVQCSCPSGERGDPKEACVTIGCSSNDECPPERACINQKCQDLCKANPCGLGAHCINQDHNFTCSCPLGHHGHPTVACNPLKTACVVDRECGIGLVCMHGMCTDPCKEERPCASNAKCTIQETRPIKSVTCTCPPGFTGDAQVQCRRSMKLYIFINFIYHHNQDYASIICVILPDTCFLNNILIFFYRFNMNMFLNSTPL